MMTSEQLQARDARRDMGAELLAAVQELQAGIQWPKVAIIGRTNSVGLVSVGICPGHRSICAHPARVGARA